MGVTVTNPAPRRWVATWPDPDDEETTRWEVVWKQGATVKDTQNVRNNRSVYRAPKADALLNHSAVVRAINDLGVFSASSTGNITGTETEDVEATGTVKKHAGANTPALWLRCNGTSYATATYADLFAVIGYTYGGSGASFLVPDFRGRSPMGVGTTSSLADNEGAAEGSRGAGHDHGAHGHNHGHGAHAHGHGHGSHGHGHAHDNVTGGHTHSTSLIGTSAADLGPASGGGGTPTDLTRKAHTHSLTGSLSGAGTHQHQADSTGGTPAGDSTGGTPAGDSTGSTPASTQRPHLRMHFIIRT